MSRPGPIVGPSGSEASGSVGSGPSGPLRVVAERLSADEAHAAEIAEAERRAADLRRADLREGRRGPTMTVAPPTAPVPAGVDDGSWGPVATVTRLRAPGNPAPATEMLATRERAPVPFDLPPRRSGFAELLALVTGRRRTGRHRPDCVRRQSWSMFSPGRRPRRRGRSRTWA